MTRPPDIGETNRLIENLSSVDVNVVLGSLSDLPKILPPESTAMLFGLMETHSDPRVRMKTAMAFRAHITPSAMPHIFAAIERPENYDYLGTFLYALQPYDCRAH